MIRINLLGDEVKQDSSTVLMLGGIAASVVALLVICFFLNTSISKKIETLELESQDLELNLAQLKKTTKEVRDLEKKRNQLNSKLAVIGRLKKNKSGPVRVLDDLNLAIPERCWLTKVQEKGGFLEISGMALDNQTIATFMKDLSSSHYFDEVDLVQSKQTVRRGVKVQSFTIRAKVIYSGKLVLATDEATQSSKNKKG